VDVAVDGFGAETPGVTERQLLNPPRQGALGVVPGQTRQRPSLPTGRGWGSEHGGCLEGRRGDEGRRLIERGHIDPVEHSAALPGPEQEPGIEQDIQVVGDRRLGEIELGAKVTHPGLTLRDDQRHKPKPHRVGERLQNSGGRHGLRNREHRRALLGWIRHTSILTDVE